MSGALVIAGSIFFLAAWLTPSKHDEDLVFPMVVAIACVLGGLSMYAF